MRVYRIPMRMQIMNAKDIGVEIINKVAYTPIDDKSLALAKKYRYWYIGVTADPVERKKSHKDNGANVAHWEYWRASSETIARSVEKYFLKLGMKGGAGGGQNPTYVYIFNFFICVGRPS